METLELNIIESGLDLENCKIIPTFFGRQVLICRTNVDFRNMRLKDFPFRIDTVEWNFDISRNEIRSFKNGPSNINGLANFCFNIELNSLDHAPVLNPVKYSTEEALDWILIQKGITPDSERWTYEHYIYIREQIDGLRFLQLSFDGTLVDDDMIEIYHLANVYKTWNYLGTFEWNTDYLYNEYLKRNLNLSHLSGNKYFPRIDGTELGKEIGIL